MDGWRLSLVTIAVAALAGCGRGTPHPATAQGRLALAELPGLRSSPDQRLAGELALVEQDGGLPLQIAPASVDQQSAQRRTKAAEGLNLAFPPLSRQMIAAPLAEIYSGGPLALSPVQIERGRELIARHAAASEKFRAALPTAAGQFGSRLADGMLADLGFLEPLSIGCRLEAVAAAVALADDEPPRALKHLATLLTTARVLAEEPNVTTRVAAANLRTDALGVLAAIANHNAATPETHAQLLKVLNESTTDWPPDARAWRGDRAGGLLVYELVRDGRYLSLLSADEIRRLDEQRTARATAQAAARNIDEDERYYLQAMRQLIDACQQPFCQRLAVLEQLRRELAAQEQSADYPLVAATLLLADFETAHRRQAEDLARCQAWLIALGTALGQPPPQAPLNSLTGSAYTIERTPLSVTVSGVLPGRDEPCVVPVLTVAQRN
jgi:hypothetical protein